ncbi:MAG: hypothetical protein R3248_07030 [Candidatus Promineifilaceae bacterium]|nr:hypothetical protein [Candidatus Promineifilaceae bacterium]
MALSALVALLALLLALIGQSPRLMRRLGLDVYRLDLRVRALTGYAFAFLLLMVGFFLAGVPLGAESAAEAGEAEEMAGEMTPPVAAESSRPVTVTSPVLTGTVSTMTTPAATSATPASGAFFGFPSSTITGTIETTATVPAIPSPTVEGAEAATGTPTRVLSPTPTSTQTPSATPTASPTPTTTPSPTASPTPTITPTPIDAPTATVDSDGSSIWVFRSPGGQQLVIVEDGATLILLSRHANQGGVLWREIMTVEGLVGWIQEQYLSYPDNG